MIEFFVITSDKYVHLMEDYPYFFNKNWSNNIFVNILGYKPPECELPVNFSFHSLGNQDDFGKYWTNALIPYFENVKSEYIAIFIDDLFFITPVDLKKVFGIFDVLEAEDKTIDKLLLGWIPDAMLKNSTPFTEDTILLHKDIEYRTTLKPSIWKTEYFMKMLKPNYNVWDFELKNMKESQIDGSVIICHKELNLITEFNVYDKGVFNYKNYCKRERFMSDSEQDRILKYMGKQV